MSDKTQEIAEEIVSGHIFRSLMTGKDWTENNLKMLRYEYEIWCDAGGEPRPFVKKKVTDPPEFSAMMEHAHSREIYPNHSGYHRKFGIEITSEDKTPLPQPYLRKNIFMSRFLRIRKASRTFNTWFNFHVNIGDYSISWHPIKKKDWVPRPERKNRAS